MARDYFHWTHASNLARIMTEGLNPAECTTRKVAVWFTTPSKAMWAGLHISERHGWDVTDMVLLKLRLPPSRVKTHRHRHVKYVTSAIPADRIEVVMILQPTRLPVPVGVA